MNKALTHALKNAVSALLIPAAVGLLAAPSAMAAAKAPKAADIVRHKIPNSDFPIALAVTICLLYTSPSPRD